MTSPSSFNVGGLLGANSIDTTTLINQLVQAAAIPQSQLKTQLSAEQNRLSAFQTINTRLTAVQTAANTLLDPTSWAASAASSSSTAVVASSDSTALPGATTFDVVALASAQVSTTAVGANGVVVSTPANGLSLTLTGDPTPHPISLTSGTATDVVSAINTAGLGVHASLVNIKGGGQVLQLTSTTTGTKAGFSISGFDSPFNTIVTAKDAQINVGDPAAGGYSVTSATNTFTNVIQGVTFSVGAVASGVTVTVSPDRAAVSDRVKALVDAANSAHDEIVIDSGQGGVLQAHYEVSSLASQLSTAVSKGGPNGASLKTYGIDMDKNGQLSFDAAAFQAAFAADPTGTQNAVAGAFATSLKATADHATAAVTGTITQQMQAAADHETNLNKQIDAWGTRLTDLQTSLQAKYAVMNAALAKLQSQSTYLTSMLKAQSSSNNNN